MSQKTKTLIAVISIIAVLGMTACGNKDNGSPKTTTTTTAVTAEDSEPEEKKPELLKWTELAKLDTYGEFRAEFDKAFEITTDGDSKSGCLYADTEGNKTGNSTLFYALNNKTVREHIADEKTFGTLKEAVKKEFTDLKDGEETAAVYNAYFDILPSDTSFNGSSTLTRSQAMALVMRASTPVTASGEPDNYKSFIDKVGLSSYTPFAAAEDKNVYLSTETGLDSTTAEGSMTRGEYVYLVMSSIYTPEEIAKVDTANSKLTDCTELKSPTGTNAEILTASLKAPDSGAPTEIFKALIKANSLGAIDPETRWDEAITKTEAIDIYVNSVYNYAEDKQIQIEKEEAAKIQARYEEEAKESYKNHKDEVSCKENEYVEYYVKLRNDGEEKETAEKHTIAEFMKKEPEEVKVDKDQVIDANEDDNNNNGGNDNNNGGNDNTYTPPSDNGGGNNGGGNDNNYTPPAQPDPEPAPAPAPEPTPAPPSDNGGGNDDYSWEEDDDFDWGDDWT